MTTPQSRLLKLADEAVADYNATHAAGGEAVYPSWVEDVRLLCNAAPGVSTVEDERQAFEAWAEDQGFVLDCDFFEVSGQYYDQDDTQLAYDIWRAARASVAAPAAGDALDVDALANAIRSIDGKHTMGAAALAEALMPFIQKAITAAMNSDTERLDFLAAHGAWVAWSRDRECCRVFHVDAEGQNVPMCGWGDGKNWLTPREAIDAAIAAQRKGDA